MRENTQYKKMLLDRLLHFATRIIKIANTLPRTPAGFALASQIVRSGTSIGANCEEAQDAVSRKDFLNTINIALKESRETRYWLKVIKYSFPQTQSFLDSDINECSEIIGILSSSVKTLRSNSQLSTLNSQLNKGLSILEVILAVAFFAIFSSASVVAFLQGLQANRLGKEETIAVQYAKEGIEAVKSVKNQAYTNLLTPNPTPRGLVRNANNMWAFTAAGTNNILNSGKNYTRTIKIESVNRDSNGDIVPIPTGSLDFNSKKVTSEVTWNFNSTRVRTINFSTYLSDWKKALSNGVIIYGDTTTTPKSREYTATSNSFDAGASTLDTVSGFTFKIRTSPLKREAIGGYVDLAGTLQILCFDGIIWNREWSATVGGNGSTARFDIAYETNSGDVLVVYSKGVGSPSVEMGYRTKPGSSNCGLSNWSGESPLDAATTLGIVHWVKMAWDRRPSSDLIAAIWADANRDLSAMIWSGSSWGNEPSVLEQSLEVVSAGQDVDDFDVEYESLSGDVLVVWANSAGADGTNGVRYRECTGGTSTCTWGAVTTPPTFSDDAHNLDISANPNDDQILFASIGNEGDDLQVGRWDGSAWANVANKDRGAQSSAAGAHLVDTGWLISGGTTRGVVVYHANNTTRVDYTIMTPGSPPTWSGNLSFSPSPTFGRPRYWYDVQMDPLNKDNLIFTVSDTNSRLYAKRLVMSGAGAFTWSNTDANSPGGSPLEATLGQRITSPFSFAYFRQP